MSTVVHNLADFANEDDSLRSERFAQLIRRRMHELGLTRDAFAKALGRSRSWLYKAMNGDVKQMQLGTLVRLADVLHVHPWILFRAFYAFNDEQDKLEIHDSDIKRLDINKFSNINNQKTSLYPGDESVFIRDVTFPDGTLVPVNEEFDKIWEIANCGHVVWENRRLVCADEKVVLLFLSEKNVKLIDSGNLAPVQKEVPISYTKPGQNVDIKVTFRAPKMPGTVVSYWKMVDHAGKKCFPNLTGLYCKVKII